MDKIDLGDLLAIEGVVIFICCSLFWVITSISYRLYSHYFFSGLMVLPMNLTLIFIIAGFIVKAGRGKKDIKISHNCFVFKIVYLIIGVYNFMLITLIDSPNGPPILGPGDFDVNTGSLEMNLLVAPKVFLILSGIWLLIKDSQIWLEIGFAMLILSMGALQFWSSQIIMVYQWFSY